MTTTIEPHLEVGAIHDDAGYRALRTALAQQYALSEREPNIQIVNVDVRGDRSLTLRHFRNDRRPLALPYKDVLRQFAYLWGFTVRLETAHEDGTVVPTHECRVEKRRVGALSPSVLLRTLP